MKPFPIPDFPLPPSISMHPREVFEHNPDFSGYEEQFKLRPYEWELYLWFDGRRTVQEISEARKVELSRVAVIVERLQKLALIRVVEIGLDEFHCRFVEAPATVPTADGKRVSASLRHTPVAPATEPVPVLVPTIQMETDSTRVRMSARGAISAQEELHLQGLIDFIIAGAGGGTVGQLAVYRVFLKAPNELMKQVGITSLNLAGTDFIIRNAELQRILLGAVEEVLGRPYNPPPQSHRASLSTEVTA